MSRIGKIYNVGHNVKEDSSCLAEGYVKVLKAMGFSDEMIANVHCVTASAIQLGMKPSGRQTESGFLRLYNRSLTEVLMGLQDANNVLTNMAEVMAAKTSLDVNRGSWRFDFTNPKVIEAREDGYTDQVMIVVPFIYDDSALISGRGCTNILTRMNILELEIIWKPETVQPENVETTSENPADPAAGTN